MDDQEVIVRLIKNAAEIYALEHPTETLKEALPGIIKLLNRASQIAIVNYYSDKFFHSFVFDKLGVKACEPEPGPEPAGADQ